MYKKILILVCIVVSACAKSPNMDGVWWRTIPDAQRLGFLAGAIDYMEFDRGDSDYRDASWDSLEPKIETYYSSHPNELSAPVLEVLKKSVDGLRHKKISNGEHWAEKHGIFDGEYWRQSDVKHRIGFVQGYLEAGKAMNDSSLQTHESVEYLATRVSSWYGIKDDDPSDIDVHRVGQKIAIVIRMHLK